MKMKSIKKQIFFLIATGFILVCLLPYGCSGSSNEKTDQTPTGVINLFVSRILDDADFIGALELLKQEDRELILKNEQASDFLNEKPNPEIDQYRELLDEILPEMQEKVKELVKIKPRKSEQKDGYHEVDVEISYPSDQMTLMLAGMNIMSNIQNRIANLDLDTLSIEQKKKILWTVKNDVNRALETINKDKYSTYIFPVKVVEEDNAYRIDLGLSSSENPFDF